MVWLWVLSWSALASESQPTVDLADESQLQFDLGVSAYRAGRLEQALEHLLMSHRLVPNLRVVFNIARTYDQLGRFDQAYRHYTEVLRLGPDAGSRDEALASLQRIAGQVARVTIETTPAGATVYVARRDLGSRGTTPLVLALPEGEHTVLLELAGWGSTEHTVSMVEGELTELSLELKPEGPTSSQTPPADSVAQPTWTSATVRADGVVLLRVAETGCTLWPGTVGGGALVGALDAEPGGSALAAGGEVQALVVDWTLADGTVLRQALPRTRKRDLWLADASAVRPLLSVCGSDGVSADSLGAALSELATPTRRDAVALLGEWATARGASVSGTVLSACGDRRDCDRLAAVVASE